MTDSYADEDGMRRCYVHDSVYHVDDGCTECSAEDAHWDERIDEAKLERNT